MLSSFRIRIGNISPSATQWHFPLQNGKHPKKPPLPLARRGPSIQHSNASAHAPPQTAAPTVEALSHGRHKIPIGYNGGPQIRPPKVPPRVDRSPNRTTCLISGPVRPMMPKGIRIRSAVFPQCTRQTDAQNDRWSTGKFDHYRPLSL